MPLTTDAVIDALRPVQDPELHRSIVDLDMVRDVAIKRGSVDVTIALTVAGCPMRAEIDNRVKGAISVLDDVRDVRITFTVMTDDERAALRHKLHGDPASTAGSQLEVPDDLVRLSVGIEDPADLLADLEQALRS